MTELREAVICSPLRTPVGRYGGALAALPAQRLASHIVTALVQRTSLPGDAVDDVIVGQCYPTMEAAPIGRVAALDAGLPVTATGYQLDRRCGSGLQAVVNAAMQVQTGVSDLVIAGGVESMSNAPYYTEEGRRGLPPGSLVLHDALTRGRERAGGELHLTPEGNLGSAELLRLEYGIGRERQDAYALQSHRRAVAAQESGAFDAELVPVEVPGRKGSVVVDRDEHPRADTSLEALGRLRPALSRSDPEATVTAGNASGQNDAAAACIVSTPERAAELGLTPLLRLVTWAVAGVEPQRFGIGPVPAANKALARAGLGFDDLDVIELNEAFAVQVLACLTEWGIADDDPRLNPRGSGISIGHPLGATGVRMLATLAHELPALDGRFALETMCIGGGQGLAAVFERV
ncbi:acetyl-CoA C-acetyltransferase [Amnibacterium sp. CER49]|uniref:acetyl-CoA C-acetyltransferase n=1 Tax=Amnibacterium sp. CER49 TaxID=3039161 RepID=UPI00244712AF|nr:acetyl-CoA C-acetyltransferase [Amnibacterium sp. CER49]MDH2443182.1 acetyl-CoA C-acetyltransferase [Amnibacterium sp. CER49]